MSDGRELEVTHMPNQQSTSGLVEKVLCCLQTIRHALKLVTKYGEDWMKHGMLYRAQKHRNSVVMHACEVLPFSVTNELGLENHLSYPCAKFGENQ